MKNKLREVVVNKRYGGFDLSNKAILRMQELGSTVTLTDYYSIPRDDKLLVQVVKELGAEANGSNANLLIVEIPSDVEWEIDEYDGFEKINEVHRSW